MKRKQQKINPQKINGVHGANHNRYGDHNIKRSYFVNR